VAYSCPRTEAKISTSGPFHTDRTHNPLHPSTWPAAPPTIRHRRAPCLHAVLRHKARGGGRCSRTCRHRAKEGCVARAWSAPPPAPRAAVTDTRRSEEQANLPAVASLRSRAPSASLTWPRWSRPEALVAVLELELGPVAAHLRGPVAELERKLKGQANIRRFIKFGNSHNVSNIPLLFMTI
jgi:hypothetical protein